MEMNKSSNFDNCTCSNEWQPSKPKPIAQLSPEWEEQLNKLLALKEEYFKSNLFSSSQMEVIYEGITDSLDVSIYAKPEFNANQMWEIYEGLCSGLDVSIYADPKFNVHQMYQIRLGQEQFLEVRKYSSTAFNDSQMREIRLGLLKGDNVSFYARPEFSWEQMREIRSVPYRQEAEKWVTPDLSAEFIAERRIHLTRTIPSKSDLVREENHFRGILDKNHHLDPEFSLEQVAEICKLKSDDCRIKLLTSDLTRAQMIEVRLGIETGLEHVYDYARPSYSVEEMREIRKYNRPRLSRYQLRY